MYDNHINTKGEVSTSSAYAWPPHSYASWLVHDYDTQSTLKIGTSDSIYEGPYTNLKLFVVYDPITIDSNKASLDFQIDLTTACSSASFTIPT